MKRLIALDVGDVWIGVAVTDLMQMFVHPRDAVKNDQIFLFLEKFFSENEVEAIILGFPITMKGIESEQTKKVINLKNKLAKKFENLKIIFQDERLSSKFAEKILRENKLKKNSEHSISACIILENFLMKSNY